MAFLTSTKFSYFLLISLLCVFASSQLQPQTCPSYKFSNPNKSFSSCSTLPVLNSVLHWNYHASTRTAEIAYRQTNTTTSRWHAWAINPTSTGMVGSQAIVAYQDSHGVMHSYPSPVTAYRTSLAQGSLSFPVTDISATFENDEVILFATLVLPGNTTEFHHVWQDGPINGGRLGIHPLTGPFMKSYGTIDFMSGKIAATTGGADSKQKNKYIHGILCGLTWGILMPMGVMAARYLKLAQSTGPSWFHLHRGCQSFSYAVGVIGFGFGVKLGIDSAGIQYNPHRYIAIVLAFLGTSQVFSLVLRPNPDHKYRMYWNIFHQLAGYTVILLSIVNVFVGFSILKPDEKWKIAYIAIIAVLGAIALCLEAVKSYLVWRKKTTSAEKNQNGEIRNMPLDVV